MQTQATDNLLPETSTDNKEIREDLPSVNAANLPHTGNSEENKSENDSYEKKLSEDDRKYSKERDDIKNNLSAATQDRYEKNYHERISNELNLVKDSVDSLINYSQTPQGKNEHEADSFINYMDGEESKIKYDDEQSPTPMRNEENNSPGQTTEIFKKPVRERSRDEEKKILAQAEQLEIPATAEEKPAKSQAKKKYALRRTGRIQTPAVVSNEAENQEIPNENAIGNENTIGFETSQLPEHLKVRRAPGRPRGKPRNNEDIAKENGEEGVSLAEQSVGQKRGVGRPKKYPDGFREALQTTKPFQQLKRGRGRPKKAGETQDAQNTEGLLNSNSKDFGAMEDEGAEPNDNDAENESDDGETPSKTPGSTSVVKDTPIRRGPGRPKKAHRRKRGRPPKDQQSETKPTTEPVDPAVLPSKLIKRTRGRPRKGDMNALGTGFPHGTEGGITNFESMLEGADFSSFGENSMRVDGFTYDESIEKHDLFSKPVFVQMHNNIYGDGEIGSGKLKITSWNLQGIPAGKNIKFIEEYLNGSDADILCLQEFKMDEREFLDQKVAKKFDKKYFMYLSCNKADGVGDLILTKLKPLDIQEGMKHEKHDVEGRVIILEFKDLFVVTVNFPSSRYRKLNYRVKEWDVDFNNLISKLKSQKKEIIIVGDMNVSHTELDYGEHEHYRGKPGFTEEEQQNFSKLLELGFVDTFRHCYPQQKKWTQSTVFNETKRTDYAIVSKELLPAVVDSLVLDYIQTGSHFPIELRLKL